MLLRYVERTGVERTGIERSGVPPDVPDAWLFSVTRNLAIDRLRRRRLERETPASMLDAGLGGGDPVPAPDDDLEHRERCREAIRRLLERSTPRDVATTLLREVFGSDYADIARAGGRSRAGCRQVGAPHAGAGAAALAGPGAVATRRRERSRERTR